MIRVLVMADNSLLGDAMMSRLTDELGLDAIHLTHRCPDVQNQPSMVIVLDEGHPGREPLFYSLSSPYKMHELEKRDATLSVWAICRI